MREVPISFQRQAAAEAVWKLCCSRLAVSRRLCSGVVFLERQLRQRLFLSCKWAAAKSTECVLRASPPPRESSLNSLPLGFFQQTLENANHSSADGSAAPASGCKGFNDSMIALLWCAMLTNTE